MRVGVSPSPHTLKHITFWFQRNVTYSPRLKAGAATLNTTAKFDPRLSVAPIDCRCPGSFDVNGRIVIPVNRETTIAIQNPIAQGEIMLLSATGTGLGRWGEAVNLHDAFPTLERHPFQDAQEAAEAQIAHLASPHGLHTVQVQILKVQHVVFVAQSMCQFEMVVTSLIGYIGAMLGEGSTRVFAPFRAINLARQFAAEPACFADALSEILWAGMRPAFIVG